MGTSVKMVVNLGPIIAFLFMQQAIAEPTEENPCPDHWIKGDWVGLGCLLFNTTTKYSFEDAFAQCQDQDSTLLEIHFQEQLDFIQMEIASISDHEGTSFDWWTAGTDLGKEGRWMWLGSLSSVPDFLWHTGYPRLLTDHNCLLIENSFNYEGYDYKCSYNAVPICQRNTLI